MQRPTPIPDDPPLSRQAFPPPPGYFDTFSSRLARRLPPRPVPRGQGLFDLRAAVLALATCVLVAGGVLWFQRLDRDSTRPPPEMAIQYVSQHLEAFTEEELMTLLVEETDRAPGPPLPAEAELLDHYPIDDLDLETLYELYIPASADSLLPG